RLQEGGPGRRRQVEQRRDRLPFPLEPGGEDGVVEVAVEQQYRRLEAVAVLDDEGYRPLEEGRPARRRHEVPAVLARVADVERRRPAQRLLQQRLRPDAVVAGLPDSVALQAGHRLDARLAALAPLQLALQRLQRVDAEDL